MSAALNPLTRPSPYNAAGPARAAVLNDCTLREGEQSSSVAFTTAERCRIAEAIVAAGIPRLQIALSKTDARANRDVISAAAGADTEALILAFADDWRQQMEIAVAAGVTILNVIVRASPRLLELLGSSPDDLVARSQESVAHARAIGARPVFSAGDTLRAEYPTLQRVYAAAIDSGAEAIYVLDTSGCAAPSAVSRVVGEIAQEVDVPIGIHAHNDLGLALANALAAYEAGATLIDTCVNGMGDRCGNPSTDEVAVACAVVYGRDTGVRLDRLAGVSDLVAELSGVPIAASKPLLGPNAHSHKLDIHVRATLDDPLAFQPVHPELVGRRFSIALGKRSGPVGLTTRLRELALPELDDAQTAAALAEVEAYAETNRAVVPDDVLAGIVDRVRAANAPSQPR
jgi:isopropylmalate/homocitrate/citramalate synthase